MTSQRDLERTLDAFFALGADEVADRAIDAALLTIEQTPQRRALRVPWRIFDMSSSMKLVTVAAAMVLVVVGASWILGRGTGTGVGGGGSPSPTASASAAAAFSPSVMPSASPSPSISTAGWTEFSSVRYGYRIEYPPTWTATPATRDWVLATDRTQFATTAADHFIDKTPATAGYQILVTAFAVDVPAGTSEDAWITAYFLTDTDSCGITIANLVPTTVDGRAGRIGHTTCGDSQAFVFVGTRVHVFAVWRSDQGAFLDAVLSTVRFETPAPSPDPSLGAGAIPGPS